MSTELWISLLASVISLVAIGSVLNATYRKTGSLPSREDITKGIEKIPILFKEFESVGLMAVAAAEQLGENGELKTDDQKFKDAFDTVDRWSNQILGVDLDSATTKRIVEGSYKIFKETVLDKRKLYMDNHIDDTSINVLKRPNS